MSFRRPARTRTPIRTSLVRNHRSIFPVFLFYVIARMVVVTRNRPVTPRTIRRFRKVPLRLKAKLFPLNPVCYPSGRTSFLQISGES
jgi:hypothetical protein